MRLVIGGTLVLALAGAASAATTRKVPQDYANIQAAEDAAQDGDTILVSKGRYILDATVNIDVPNLIVKGSGAIVDGARPNQDNDDIDCFYVSSSNVTITGFTFRNGNNPIYGDGQNLLVTKCTFIDSAGASVYLNSGDGARVESCKFFGGDDDAIESYVANPRFLKNTIRSFDDYGINGSGNGVRYEANTVSFLGTDRGIYNSAGANAVVLKNKFFNIDDEGIRIVGNDAVIEGNTILNADNNVAITVDGLSPRVARNKVTDAGGGIDCQNADGAEVLSNKIVNIHGSRAGVEVEADTMTVTGNSVKLGSANSYGFYLYSQSVAGGGIVDKNSVVDLPDSGFYFGDAFFHGVEVSNCVASNCGSWDAAAFWISNAVGSSFTALKATNINNMGVYVDGTNNDFLSCKVTNVYGDGFRVVSGSDGNTFTNCSAANCGGEGFDNRGTNTELVGGKYRGDRNDVANDTTNGATITLTNVDKLSPGTPQSQVD